MDVEVPGLERIAIGDPDIADLHVANGSTISLVGGKAGRTTLLAWTNDGKRHQWSVAVAGRSETAE